MDQADLTEISEALWAGAKQAEISQTLCYKQTDACKKKPPPLPKVISSYHFIAMHKHQKLWTAFDVYNDI
jgi:hypothetical protein